jgi:hypothetical protein
MLSQIMLTVTASTSIHKSENEPPLLVEHAQVTMPLGPGARVVNPEDEPGTLISVQLKSLFKRRAFVCCSSDKQPAEQLIEGGPRPRFRKPPKI